MLNQIIEISKSQTKGGIILEGNNIRRIFPQNMSSRGFGHTGHHPSISTRGASVFRCVERVDRMIGRYWDMIEI
jgi:hypothetical protein